MYMAITICDCGSKHANRGGTIPENRGSKIETFFEVRINHRDSVMALISPENAPKGVSAIMKSHSHT